MKRKTVYIVVTLVTIFALNVQGLGLWQTGEIFNVANALPENVQKKRSPETEGRGGVDFIRTYKVPVTDVVVVTQTTPNPGVAEDLHCSWECGEEYYYPAGFVAIPEMCTEANEMVDAIRADIQSGSTGDWDGNGLWGADSVYSAGDKVAWDGLWVWEKYSITTGIGWTGWWVGLANYCEARDYWSGSNKQAIRYGDTVDLTFTIAERTSGPGTYAAQVLAKTAEIVRIQGSHTAGGTVPPQTITTPNFNSPFVYLSVPNGAYSVRIDSEWDLYQSVTPAFTGGAQWNAEVQDGDMYVGGVKQEHLFYELAMHRVDLTRNGMNFDSKETLIEYLENSNFFSNLSMTEIEKESSLNYLVPKLPDAKNYYLTVLTDESVYKLSELTVTPAPEKLVRTYYAVYPTAVPVRTQGGFSFDVKDVSGESVVKEYGEIIVKPEMYVFWK